MTTDVDTGRTRKPVNSCPPAACLQRLSTTAKSSRLRLHLQPASAPPCVLSFIPFLYARHAGQIRRSPQTAPPQTVQIADGLSASMALPSSFPSPPGASSPKQPSSSGAGGVRARGRNKVASVPGACVSLPPGSQHTLHLHSALLLTPGIAMPHFSCSVGRRTSAAGVGWFTVVWQSEPTPVDFARRCSWRTRPESV